MSKSPLAGMAETRRVSRVHEEVLATRAVMHLVDTRVELHADLSTEARDSVVTPDLTLLTVVRAADHRYPTQRSLERRSHRASV